MIFVTVGNHFQGFDRLLKKVDEIAPNINDEIIIQKGYSKYVPQNTKFFDFVSMETSIEYIRKAKLVISHAGIGTIILCKKYNIPIIVLPRRKKFGEHGTDHQLEIARILEKRSDNCVFIIFHEDQLENKIFEVIGKIEKRKEIQQDGKTNLIKIIRTFIESEKL